MIRVCCPRGHFIADVEVTDSGLDIHVSGLKGHGNCGLVWLYAPRQRIRRVHAQCFKRDCPYDGSMDYPDLCAELAAAVARGDTRHRLTR